MKINKQLIINAAILLFGLLLGYLIFYPGDEQHVKSVDTEQVYSCAMHPNIRQSSPAMCPLCSMELTIVDQAGTTASPYQLQMSPEAMQLAQIETATVTGASGGQKSIYVNGKVTFDERRIAVQSGHLPGRIEELYVNSTGVYIRKGQKIASVYSKELIAVLEALHYSKTNESVKRSAQNNLSSWKIDQEELKAFKVPDDYLKPINIYADVEGLVIKKNVDVGDQLSPGHMSPPTVMFEVADMKTVWVEFEVPEKDISGIRIGDMAEFEIAAFKGKVFRAKVDYIDPLVNTGSNSISVRVSLNNNMARLKPGMLAYGHIHSKTKHTNDRLTIPSTAVLWTGHRSVVYVKDQAAELPIFEYREVVLGEELQDQTIVLEGLQPGEQVVTHGAFRLDAVAQLQNKASMMNRLAKPVHLTYKPTELQLNTNVTPALSQQLVALGTAYFELKDRLVTSDHLAAGGRVKSMIGILKTVKEVEMPQQLAPVIKELEVLAAQIADSSGLDEQRSVFYRLSMQMEALFRLEGGPRVYLQYCPMAFDNTGAHWFSREEIIANPYFGDKMLRCGIVRDSM